MLHGIISHCQFTNEDFNHEPKPEPRTPLPLAPMAQPDDNASIRDRLSDFKPFMVSAPGKVIVFGEHAVVHGKAAMAASISLRSYLHVSPGPHSPDPTVTLNFPDVALSHTWTISSLPWQAFASTSKTLHTSPLPRTLDSSLVDSLQPILDPISPTASPSTRKIHHSAASTFLYLFLLLLPSPPTSSLTFTLRSTIPIGAGLGSSASISVCLSTALLHLSSSLTLPPSHSTSTPPSTSSTPEQTLDRINALAFLGESLIHGTPSGVDNTVSTLGKAVIFRRPAPGAAPVITTLRKFPELPLLVVDTKQAKSTAVEVGKVRVLRERHPEVVGRVLEGIDAVTGSAGELIAGAGEGGGEGVGKETVDMLGELVRLNHGLLVALGVSHPRLEELREVVDASGAGWFKLTGAGGGGCGFVLLKGDVSEVKHKERGGEDVERLRRLEAELDARGFERYETILGGDGVGINLFEQGHGLELDTFLAAKGTEGVEALCGGETAGWMYWRFT
ncbi:hypothetical protein KVT40_008921 [Elsinoe batatas]|uniref:Mevalonate kinase n=1 Tax=Elsinoe batatas TaxID=2601811 RepID=A0A8K0KVA6_9PEZI|nr:hypothetical protein KVT40_008921 [Elsinoe batatas]